MFSAMKLKFSWSLVGTVASIVALISVVHLFLFPVVPSFEYFSAGKATQGPYNESGKGVVENGKEIKSRVNFDKLFPADSHNAVVYHGAPWKASIGRWLSGCDVSAKEVNVVEVIGGQICKSGCSGQGVCNHELGKCSCFHGYDGEACSERQQLDCNNPAFPDAPYGRWVVSICSAYCDTTKAMCFCGNGTKYPNRPVAEACGFKVNQPSQPGAPKSTDWTKADLDNIFTQDGSKPGWCNVDPAEAYASNIKFKEECDCKYDGLSGRFCEVPVLSTCINQCSGHGHCRGGFCECRNGWYGTDCSIPSVMSSVGDWPLWLRPAHIDVPSNENLATNISLKASVQKKRPLIYVYDLPPEFNSLLLEGRHFRFECVNRLYDNRNATMWTDQLYGAQMALYESILASPHRTLNGDEADFFFVPVLDSCIITRADDAPHLTMENHLGIRSSFTLDFYKKAYEHISGAYPYWNRSSGKDHIWFFSWDEGACYAPKEIWNSMMLVHWGNTNLKHKNSTTAYWADKWDGISSKRKGNHPCYEPDKDLVLPAWKIPDANVLKLELWARTYEERKTLFYFNGNLGRAYENGRPEDTSRSVDMKKNLVIGSRRGKTSLKSVEGYSMGIRQKLAAEFGSSPNKKGELGKQNVKDVIVTSRRSDNYHQDLASSIFCGVLPGDGWSGRMEDSILQGCIPVVIQDGIFLPYENVLNYDSFAVRIQEDDIPNLVKILRRFNEAEVRFKLDTVQRIWQRFVYRDSIMLEAERQKHAGFITGDWETAFSQLTGDDVFATFIQALHYKLHNDPWRQTANRQKDFGILKECLMRTPDKNS